MKSATQLYKDNNSKTSIYRFLQECKFNFKISSWYILFDKAIMDNNIDYMGQHIDDYINYLNDIHEKNISNKKVLYETPYNYAVSYLLYLFVENINRNNNIHNVIDKYVNFLKEEYPKIDNTYYSKITGLLLKINDIENEINNKEKASKAISELLCDMNSNTSATTFNICLIRSLSENDQSEKTLRSFKRNIHEFYTKRYNYKKSETLFGCSESQGDETTDNLKLIHDKNYGHLYYINAKNNKQLTEIKEIINLNRDNPFIYEILKDNKLFNDFRDLLYSKYRAITINNIDGINSLDELINIINNLKYIRYKMNIGFSVVIRKEKAYMEIYNKNLILKIKNIPENIIDGIDGYYTCYILINNETLRLIIDSYNLQKLNSI